MKIFLFGKSSVGKTTIGKKLSEKFDILFFELDKVFWDFESNTSITEESLRIKIIDNLLKDNNDWIIEGLYRQDFLNKIINDSDYIFFISKNDYLIDLQIIYRFFKRIFGIEKSERESSFSLIGNFIKANHSKRFENIHLEEFKTRLLKSNKEMTEVKNIDEIYNLIN